MAIGLEEKKSSSLPLQKILIALLVLSAAFALFFFFGKIDFSKKASQEKDGSVPEVKKINIDFEFLRSSTISSLKSFPSFPSFFGSASSSDSVKPGRENPFIPYTIDAASNKGGNSPENDIAKKEELE